MEIHKDYDLTKLNTFGISVSAKFFIEIHDKTDLENLFDTPEFKNNKKLFLGGGSNILFTKNFDGLVVLNKLKGIKILSESSTDVVIHAMSGEIWHDLVIFAVERGYWGIENLSLIPGTVGAAPMQNIGAYGAELRDVLESVEAYDLESGKENKKKVFSREECLFGYRDSIFKNELKDKYFIFAITLKLSKVEKKNISYKILREYLENLYAQTGNKIVPYSLKDISDAVGAIRKSKLPDPAIIPNAGSFFKNIFVEEEKLNELLKIYPNMPYFEEKNGRKNGSKASVFIASVFKKIPAAWLIEQCGWKGKRIGNVGVHNMQALVLVNYGGATEEEVKNLAESIIADVKNKFGLVLIPEVNLI
ncbi:UDP-N-acetylenolpyruvoylglucosamine reductase [Candidatus Nomurabacteria bacterium RIFCSPHIGHO2_01_FULL_37_25]|uniref:UDP-N-acetylenolpyruvoylglucosamine reductase n=1 Tax=Candidatus Nomurabacteria bacterium RIFCSPLOWO2_01_FULL_36_16 TaxID=1801767 RepID=A0A1F6WYZ0_9BACT|nr:MAG: UDP-N-acetylenolpyruvoylglucosamine reductase [Candidatus Nomurabacteria bacterium RIFCSPHIGHO2_01_FULL_37_25]OGI75759.1 MAG: UDP-N-acetylenolpyruvoylglucosamine reductase [Candidatus Nomurabacteria bacterium RIFCSPHIGHO2_02_FULL_36_29]OGI86994.1 MAG: UDP-N-acetylenolpyruvoylglucosamine reductase [Candidatus Nomurabacteria bacterium RIFCSPLOWO2_01_FULL_36_16]OGI97046.1 MAG: UDP-N-acetylenolpyruvoylglucosamine reductase [Candidatus Nomurabacteria bacterium RIFCSPLOWO2_02_FULL_36_8]